MLKKRIIITLTFNQGVLFRTKKFNPDYRYTKNFIDFWSVDELVLIDVSKKKFQKSFIDIINFFSRNCFVPISVGGGIKSLKDADLYFDNGADKIILGSNVIKEKETIRKISKKYGNQSIIQSIDYLKKNDQYLICRNSGKELLNIEPIDWALESLELGAGEILLNSIENDGSLLGFDLHFIKEFSNKVRTPILALGGCGNWKHILDLFEKTQISAACTQNIYHFTNDSIKSAKNYLSLNGVNIRK